jgi:hypothetical protein
LKDRSTIARQLERWLGQLTASMQHQVREHESTEPMSDADCVRELQRIALGLVPGTRPSDRISAIKTLLVHRKTSPGEAVAVNVLMINHRIVTNDDGTTRELPNDPETGVDSRRDYLRQLGHDVEVDETVDDGPG